MTERASGEGGEGRRVLITGVSSGLGWGLARQCLARGDHVFAVSRRGAPRGHELLREVRQDLTDPRGSPEALNELLSGVGHLDLVFLNAGVLGSVRPMTEVPLEEARHIMEVNVWANKVILDHLHAREISLGQVIGISSGAAVSGSRGFAGYAVSKAALNVLLRVYAPEFPDAHLVALAPGLVATDMIDELLEDADLDAFPALRRIHEARGTEQMPGPEEAARRILDVLPRLRSYPSGDFVDIRRMEESEA